MLRAGLIGIAAALVVPLSVVIACNDVEVKPFVDGGGRVCDPGPFIFEPDGENGFNKVAVGLSAKPSGPACSADGTNLDVINRLPRGGFYPVGWKVQTQESQDVSGQGECTVATVCNCEAGTTTTPPAVDAGPDAAAPAPTPTPGEPQWKCAQ